MRLSLIAAFFLLTGCATSQQFADTALSWNGAATSAALGRLGPPAYRYSAEETGDFPLWIWEYSSSAPIATPPPPEASYHTRCTGTIYGPSGNINCQTAEQRDYSASNGYALGQALTQLGNYHCQIIATLSADSRYIASVETITDGNCGEAGIPPYGGK